MLVYANVGKSDGALRFLLRRIVRLALLYWLMTICMLVLLVVLPDLFTTTQFEWRHFLSSLMFLPYPHPVLGVQQPFLFPGWVLNYFVFIGVVFAALYKLPMAVRVWTMIGLFSMLQMLALMFPHMNRLLDFYGSPMVIEFELGMLVALLYLSQVRVPAIVILLAIAVSAVIVGIGVHNGASKGPERTLYWGVAGVGVLIACVFIERQWSWPRISILRRLGDASYAMYVSGIFSLSLVSQHLAEASARTPHGTLWGAFAPHDGRDRGWTCSASLGSKSR